MITGKIKDVNIDDNGNIRVVTDYFDELDNLVHSNGVSRYSFAVSSSIDDIMAQVESDIKDHAQYLIVRKHVITKNSSELKNIQDVAIGARFSSTTGTLVTRDKILVVDETSVISEQLRAP